MEKTINILIEDFGRETFIKGVIIFENDKIFDLKNVTITRPNGSVEHKEKWSIPKCYVNEANFEK